MLFLKRGSLACLLVLSGCTTHSFTTQISLETDTYISSTDAANHSELPQLNISKSAGGEERAVLRLPTGTLPDNPDPLVQQLLSEDPLLAFDLPYIIFLSIMEDLIDCTAPTLNAADLSNAQLVLDVVQNAGGDLTGQISLGLLAKPWWQNVTWDRAHFFSDAGIWNTPGGDLDPSFTAIPSATSGTTVTFDVTAYFRTILASLGQITHYGILLSSSNATMSQVQLASVQYPTAAQRPRVVATYTGTCLASRTSQTSTYFLGGTRSVLAPSSIPR